MQFLFPWLGQKPNRLKPVAYAERPADAPTAVRAAAAAVAMKIKGLDIFVYWPSRNANELAAVMGKLAGDGLSLQMIDNRGVKVWPAGRAETFCTDSFRCRFVAEDTPAMTSLIDLQRRVAGAGIEIAVTQTLRTFNGQAGFTLAQGQ